MFPIQELFEVHLLVLFSAGDQKPNNHHGRHVFLAVLVKISSIYSKKWLTLPPMVASDRCVAAHR